REREIAADHRTAATQLRNIEKRLSTLAADEAQLKSDKAKFGQEREAQLAKAAGLTPGAARDELFERLAASAESDADSAIRRAHKRAVEESAVAAREVLVSAMQRQVGEVSAQATVTMVPLPDEDMKGRIIGKEGRNIRAFEA